MKASDDELEKQIIDTTYQNFYDVAKKGSIQRRKV